MGLSKGQLEDRIAKEVTKFYTLTVGAGPRETRVYILEDMVIVRLKGKLLPIEEKLLEGNAGIALVKDIRKALHEITTPNVGKIIEEVLGYKVVSSHSDISTKTGERLEVYILDKKFEAVG